MRRSALAPLAVTIGLVLLAGCAVRLVVPGPPPAPLVEVRGVVPGPGHVWIGGHWSWGPRWVWVAGSWVVPPHPRAVWVPGHWRRVVGGWRWVPGSWR